MLLRVVVYYIITFFFTILLGSIQQQTGILPAEVSVPQFAPGIAALLMLLIFRKDQIKLTFASRETPPLRYLVAALIPLGPAVVTASLASLLFEGVGFPAFSGSIAWMLWMPLGALGEELGWRGYLHKRIDGELPGLLSCVVVGGLWALWHVQLYSNGALYMALFVLLMISYSVIMYTVMADTNFSVLVATIFHLFINIGNLLYMSLLTEPLLIGLSAVIWLLAAAFTVVTRRELFLPRKETAV